MYRPARFTIISVPALQMERHTSASCSCTVIPPALSISSMPPSAVFADGRNKHDYFHRIRVTVSRHNEGTELAES